jgi:DNA-binding NarL/FixJ family response regulator
MFGGGRPLRSHSMQLTREPEGRDVDACAPTAPTVDAAFDLVDLRILELMGHGLPDSTIARRLTLSHRTVQRRVQRMMVRTSVVSRFALGLRVS